LDKSFKIKELNLFFKNYETFSRAELYNFYLQFDEELKETTFRWRIYSLKQQKVISTVARSVYVLSSKSEFYPVISVKEEKLCVAISRQFPMLKYCIWNTNIVNELMLHIPNKSLTIIEVENEAIELVFNFLKNEGTKNLFFQPSEKEIQHYIAPLENAIIVQSLVTKSPTQIVSKTTTTTLEKLLVDLYSNKNLFSTYQGTELIHIFNKGYNKYVLDFSKMLSYASRRNKRNELINFLETKTDIQNTHTK
jgi:hypothetical protein